MIDLHTIETLELPKVLALVRGKALTPYGKELIDRIEPMSETEPVRTRLAEVGQMKDIINFGEEFPLYRIEDDARELLRRSQTEGARLDAEEILAVNDVVASAIELHDFEPEQRENFPAIDALLQRLRAYPELRSEILRTIDEDGLVRDSASPRLKSIRAEINSTRQKTIRRLESILAGKSKQTGWQDDVVTRRNDRYVIPVPSGRYEAASGFVHDRSQSGATLYVEPKEVVELNNQLNLLGQQERVELDRILRALTAEIGRRAETLLENTSIIGHLDLLHASAMIANQIRGNVPEIVDEPTLHLVEARHPLLVMQLRDPKKVVPTEIALGDDHQVVIVTGPNTGGKTVTLKTIGLAVLMARCGLPIAADAKSKIGCFKQIHADIGDEQSIELSLSTFSSHLRNIIRGVRAAGTETLLLFDEIGAGTDPKEGAALAESVILHVVAQGARMVATTHYSQLKTLAMEHPEVQNASLEFNRETLAPTYRLQLGLPGASYAVEIAGRLGLPPEICDRAALLVGDEERSVDKLIAQLEADLAELRDNRRELTERLAQAKQHETYYKTESERLKKEIEQRKEDALAETEKYLTETRRKVEKLVAAIRDSQADKDKIKEFHREFSQRQDGVKKRRRPNKKRKIDPSHFTVGDFVQILSLDREGEIEKLVGSDRAQVRVGNVNTTVELRNLRKLDDRPQTKQPRSVPASPMDDETVSPEIHLMGMTGEEATEALERYIDRAVVAGLGQIYVVHGKGTGALRRILTQFLKQHREVDKLRLGNWNEGGAGVTVVKLKK